MGDTRTIELRTNDPEHTLRFSSIERLDDGKVFRCTLNVRSRGFTVEYPLYIEEDNLTDAIRCLEDMDAGRPGTAEFSTQWESDFVSLTSNRLGQVMVRGEIAEQSGEPQILQFTFRTDQTVLRPLIDDLRSLLQAGS